MSGKQVRAQMRDKRCCTAAHPSRAPRLHIANYSNDAGHGSDTFADASGLTWRRALLGGVAAGAMFAGSPRSAQASAPVHSNCTIPAPNIMLCTDDHSPGINVQSFEGIQTLNVNSLTTNITPASVDGIAFFSSSSATLNSSLGAFQISTREVANHIVTVVGEAPALSVQRIATAVEYRRP